MPFNLFSFNWPKLDFIELKKRTRILVIDDEEFEYKSLFEKDGYAIDKWDDIKSEKITELGQGLYDIILLDIQGVGKDFSQDQGLGILKHLKKVNPTQIIIAYSNSDYNLKYQDFFKVANDTIVKSSDYFIFKETVDKNISIRFSYEYYYEMVLDEINKKIDEQKIKHYFDKSLRKHNIDILFHYLKNTDISKECVSIVVNVVGFALKIYSSLNG